MVPKKKYIVIILFALVLAVFCAACFSRDSVSGSREEDDSVTEGTASSETTASGSATEQSEEETVLSCVETVYGSLYFSDDNKPYMRHREVIDDKVTMEIFSMEYEQQERELFRIYFGDSSQGDPIGYLHTDSGSVPVLVAVSAYGAEEFSNQEMLAQYHVLMEDLDRVLQSIRSDSRFSVQADVQDTEYEVKEVDLQYWTVTLPTAVQCKETTEQDVYCAEFYGEVAGETIPLYNVYLGGDMEASLIGYYTVSGEQKSVWVSASDSDTPENWTEDEHKSFYEMMETVNIVLDAIVSGEDFSEVPEQ